MVYALQFKDFTRKVRLDCIEIKTSLLARKTISKNPKGKINKITTRINDQLIEP